MQLNYDRNCRIPSSSLSSETAPHLHVVSANLNSLHLLLLDQLNDVVQVALMAHVHDVSGGDVNSSEFDFGSAG